MSPSVLARPTLVVEERRRKVPLTEGRHKRHNLLPRKLRPGTDPQGSGDVGSGTDPGKNALLLGHPPGHVECLVVLNLLDAVQQRHVKRVGDEAGTDALDLVRARRPAGDDRRVRGLHSEGLEVRVDAADEAGDARDRASGADARNDGVDVVLRVLPDLRARRALVDCGVRGVRELRRHVHVLARRVLLLVELVRRGDSALHALLLRRQDEVCTEVLQERPALDAHGLGHRERELVALVGADEGERDAGVAAGRLDDVCVLVEDSPLLAVLDQRHAQTVLHGLHRVLGLHLQVDLRVDVLAEAAQQHQRRVAHSLGEVRENATTRSHCLF
eukprot:Rhum_TRINITY_DN639_c0_g1::Rhum_TRINITY_DN639_c0_g1_i1::g.2043::m.2043